VLTKKYRIGELAKQLGISKDTLVVWSEKGYIPQPHRDSTLNRGRYWLESEAEQIVEYYKLNYTRV